MGSGNESGAFKQGVCAFSCVIFVYGFTCNGRDHDQQEQLLERADHVKVEPAGTAGCRRREW